MKTSFSKTVYALVTSLAIIVCYYTIDIPLIEWCHTLKNSAVTDIFKMITKAGESQWYLVAGLAGWIVLRKQSPSLGSYSLLLFLSVAVSGIAAILLKGVFGRARPGLFLQEGIYGFHPFQIDYIWNSFPSGHATTALSAACTLALCFPRFRVLFFTAGFLIAISRVILIQHYPSDIIAGSVLGFLTTLLLYNRFTRRETDNLAEKTRC